MNQIKAGSTKSTPMRQPSIVTEIRSPKYSMGLNVEVNSMEKPAIRVKDVKKIGIPELTSAILIRSSSGRLCFVLENQIR